MTSRATKQNVGLDLAGKFACVAGGTNGIGAAIAVRLAKGGASVIIVGRSEEAGQRVVSQMKAQGHSDAHHSFIKSDLTLISAVKQTADEIARRTPNGLDYLFETTGKPPVDAFALTSEGHEKHFALQCMARFGLPYVLLKHGTLKGSLTMIAAAGLGMLSVDVEDLQLRKNNNANFNIFRRADRDSTVLDAVCLEFARRHPSLRVSHMFPGLVSTTQRDLPFGMHHIYNLISPLIALTVGHKPAETAEGAVFIGVSPSAPRQEGVAGIYSPWIGQWRPSKFARSPSNDKAIYDKMASLFD